MTGQFGKNHLGDKDEFLPTMHGFDEFFGNLYHLNAEEEPEDPDYPKDPEFKKRFGPRGVLHSWADGKGGQKIEDTGPLTSKRMETIDDEVTDHALRFIDEAHEDGQAVLPLVEHDGACTSGPTRAEKHKGKSGQGDYNDVMVAHDENVGRMLDKLDELGIADNTIVMYSTDNGVALQHLAGCRHHAVPVARRTPTGKAAGACRRSSAGRASSRRARCSTASSRHQDWLPTLLAAAGEPDIKEKLLKGHKAGDKTFKVHIDGYNMLPYLSGEVKESPRDVVLLHQRRRRHPGHPASSDWKVVLMEQRAKHAAVLVRAVRARCGSRRCSTCGAIPFERADENSNTYWDWVHLPRLPASTGCRRSSRSRSRRS